jgi:hypothetical protein
LFQVGQLAKTSDRHPSCRAARQLLAHAER